MIYCAYKLIVIHTYPLLSYRHPSLGPIPFPDKWNLPSASNMLRNSITRLSMHGRWWINDPDCIILRNATEFSLNELHAIAVVKALSGGPLVISDSLSVVPEERMQIVKQLIPPSGNFNTYCRPFFTRKLI
jgi:hypothetical protein